MTITIYKINCTGRAFDWERTEYFSLSSWQGDSYPYYGNDDGGKLYELPAQFTVRHTDSGFGNTSYKKIYDRHYHVECTLTNVCGSPCVIDGVGKRHILRESNISNLFRINH